MKLDLDFAYAQARIQARLAALPTDAEWERLAASRTFASFLEDARMGALRDWVKGFSTQSGVHDLEAGIRSLYRQTLDAVAGWVPRPWREAVSWVRWLTPLALLAHLRAGGTLPEWVMRDALLQELFSAEGELDRRYLEDAGAWCLVKSDDLLVRVWIGEWRRRWPPCSRDAARDLGALADLVRGHLETFRRCPTDEAWALRARLRARLRLGVHRQALQPVTPFLFLALTALELERLRAALVSRLLFPEQDEPTSTEAADRFVA